MVFIPPPQLATPSRPSYAEAYANILTTHRRSPLTSASSVIVLVAPDVDSLCASRMLEDLFKQDDVMHRIVPVSGIEHLIITQNELRPLTELHTLILLNMGAMLDLGSEDWFGDFNSQVTVHVIDSTRPRNLGSLFNKGEAAEQVIIWDDGDADHLEEERKAWEALLYEPEPDSDEDSDNDSLVGEETYNNEEEEEYEENRSTPRKRRSLGDGDRHGGKRRRVNEEQPPRMTREQRDDYSDRIDKYYESGLWHGQSASGTIYLLATALERVDNELLWLAIMGLTYQYTRARISREDYEKYHSIYHDEVARLNPLPPANPNHAAPTSLNPDDLSIRATSELRFMLFRHWTLYDAMFHSSYVASKLGIWKERGRKRLMGMLAKMGFSIPQTQQPWAHMDMDLKKQLLSKLEAIAPEYGLVELSYPSFMRCYGYRSQPLSAADAVEGISALLDVAHGIRMEVEIEGARNGGEWFSGGRVWETGHGREGRRQRDDERENVPPINEGGRLMGKVQKVREGEEDGDEEQDEEKEELDWWIKSFWTAFDALSDIKPLHDSLSLAMSLNRAIIRQGTSIIDKQDIRTMRNHRLVMLTQGPDLLLFAHPGVLTRLALWLVDALRDRLPGSTVARNKRKSLPFVVVCLNENTGRYVVVGVMAALEFGDVRKNEFSLAFLEAKERANAISHHVTFDASVLEVNKEHLKMFLEALCETGD